MTEDEESDEKRREAPSEIKIMPNRYRRMECWAIYG